jgi:hypothetical protein
MAIKLEVGNELGIRLVRMLSINVARSATERRLCVDNLVFLRCIAALRGCGGTIRSRR